MRLTTDSNDTMHTILSDISEAIALLDSLANEKSFTKGEWPAFLSRSAAQAQQLHRKTGLRILTERSMEDHAEEIF